MGKILDRLIATAETPEQWLQRPGKVSRHAIKGKSHKLPKPYDKRIPGHLEAPILKSISVILSHLGIWHNRIEGSGKLIHSAKGACFAASDMTGLPDFIACHKGRFIAIEAKAPGGSLSCEQYAKMLALQASGASVCVCVDPSKLAAWLAGGEPVAKLDTIAVV